MSFGNLPPFAAGLGVGAAVAAPVGPMAIICMRRTLVQGPRFGLSTGAGIAAGDACYALVAAFGLAGVMRFMLAFERPLHAAAGIFLLYLAWRTFTTPAGGDADAAPVSSLSAACASALLLTLTNPPTIVSFVAIFAALSPAGEDAAGAAALAGGVFIGSLLWWVVLTALVSAARRSLGTRTRRWIDRIAGGVIAVLGAAELRRAL